MSNELKQRPIHLGLGASALVQPDFTGGPQWYMDYAERTADDGVEGRLVSMHTFSESWDMWEMHPSGSEVVVCTAGKITLHQQADDGDVNTVTISAGEYAINPPGVWHTADVEEESTALFITAGVGTEHRPR